MTDEELKKIAGKIAKCLAMAASDNPTEAETGKRQANALMNKYNLTSGDVAASQVNEKLSKAGSKHRPPVYLSQLAAMIAQAFGCESVCHPGGGYCNTTMSFLGVGIKPELAAYTFDVLRRQIVKDRTDYSATLKRFKRANKIRMADIFCDAWLNRVYRQVREFAVTEQDQTAIAAYKQQRWGELKEDSRTSAEAKNDKDWQAVNAGARAAKDVSLHKPVQSKRGHALAHKA
jgi:hypothetical protein